MPNMFNEGLTCGEAQQMALNGESDALCADEDGDPLDIFLISTPCACTSPMGGVVVP